MSVTFTSCALVGQVWTPIEGIDGLNAANGNAADIAAAAGLTLEYGIVAPLAIEQLERRCIHFLQRHVGRPDPAIAGTVSGGDGHATMIYCGRVTGYLQSQVAALLAIAREGRKQGATHITGA